MRSSPKTVQPSNTTGGAAKLLFRIIKTERPRPTFHATLPFVQPLLEEEIDHKLLDRKPFAENTYSLYKDDESCSFGISRNISHTSNFVIYHGELIRLTLVLLNASDSDLGFVSVLVRLQTPEGTYCLLDTKSSPANIFPKQGCVDYNLQFAATVVGNFVLQCFAYYTDVDGQEHTLSQSYRFTVHLCLNFTSNVHLVEDETEWESFATFHSSPVYIVDCFVYNVCQLPVYLHEVRFVLPEDDEKASKEDRKPSTLVKDLNIPSVGEERKDEAVVLNPGDCQTFSYLVYSAIEDPLRRSPSREKILGRIFASFTRFGGELAALEPALILEEPKSSEVAMITIQIVGVPSKIVVEVPFVATVKVVNRTPQSKQLYFQVIETKLSLYFHLWKIKGKERQGGVHCSDRSLWTTFGDFATESELQVGRGTNCIGTWCTLSIWFSCHGYRFERIL